MGKILSECLKHEQALIFLSVKSLIEPSRHFILYLTSTNSYGLHAEHDRFFSCVFAIICSLDLHRPLHEVVLRTIRPQLAILNDTSIVLRPHSPRLNWRPLLPPKTSANSLESSGCFGGLGSVVLKESASSSSPSVILSKIFSKT